MKLSGVIWLEEIVEKIERKHHVTQNEVREILRNSSHFRFVEKGHRRGENVYSALGQTSAGRYLIVFFVRKKTGQALPISARDMTPARGRDMKKNKSSISKARSYAQIGEFWDKHDLSDYWGKTRKVKFDVVLDPEATYYPVQKDLAEEIKSVARKQGVTFDTLVNRWLGQKLQETRRRAGRPSTKSP